MASKSTARPAKKSGALCNGPLRSLIVPLRIADQRSGASSSKGEEIIVDDENARCGGSRPTVAGGGDLADCSTIIIASRMISFDSVFWTIRPEGKSRPRRVRAGSTAYYALH